jgi:predicted metal-binding membrane protein
MPHSSPSPFVPAATIWHGRGGVLVWIGFYTLILMSWGGIFMMMRAGAVAPAGDVSPGFWETLCITAGEAPFPGLFAMWGLMSSAMMLPTFVPALRTFRQLAGAGASDGWTAISLVAGYLSIWLGASLFGALAQLALARSGFLAPDGSSASYWLTAGLLMGAGLYQFSALKAACLSKCRMPLAFFIGRWQPGAVPALRMGVELGAICLGCCWALMGLGFVGGAMNLVWMGGATAFMTLEKLPDIGRYVTRPAGFGLITASVLTCLHAIGLF